MSDGKISKSPLLIIPDVHGRPFWKEAVARHPDSRVIFLGDYHDPYPQDGITAQESLDNFKEIIRHARNSGKCILLFGNHDVHYLCDFVVGSRYDHANADEIRRLILENFNRFAFARTLEFGHKRIFLSHAPVLKEWLYKAGIADSPWIISLACGRLLRRSMANFRDAAKVLFQSSLLRGGNDNIGSILWADMLEVEYAPLLESVDYSIFGHTRVRDAVICEKWANLDCGKAFLLRPDMSIEPA